MRLHKLAVLFPLLVCLVLVTYAQAPPAQQSTTQVWKYKIVECSPLQRDSQQSAFQSPSEYSANLLDRYGQDGWELINVLPAATSLGSAVCFFKRPGAK